MLGRYFAIVAIGLLISGGAFAHGGGGGGGHGGGGHVVYVGGVYVGGGYIPAPESPDIGDYSRIHSVAILSAIGQSVQLAKPGIEQQATVHTTAWMLDEYITSELGRLFSTRFDVKVANYDPRQLCTVQPSNDALTAYLASVPNPGVDAYIVVRSNAGNGFDRNPGLEVLGAGNGRPTQESLGFDILVIDAHTFKKIGRSFARAQYRGGVPAQFANYFAPPDRDPGSTLSPGPVQMELYHRDFKVHAAIAIVDTVRSLQLGLPLPEPGREPLKPMTAEEKPLRQVSAVAVVSAIGDSFVFAYRATGYNRHTTTMPIADWKLDDRIEALIKSALDRRFVVKDAAVDRDALAKTSAAAPVASIGFGILPQTISGLSPRNDIDAYILVLRRNGPVGLTDPVSGVGIWKHKPFLAQNETALFANFELAVVDAHTLRVLSHHSGITSLQNPNPVPYRRVAETVWSGDTDTLAPEQVPAVQETLNGILTDSLDETLLELGLTGMKREVGFDEIPASASSPGSAQASALGNR